MVKLKSVFTLTFVAILASGILSFAKEKNSNKAEATTYKVDTKSSTANWTGKKVTGQHNGTVQLKSGSIVVNSGKVEGGKFEIDVSSLKDVDIEDADMNKKLEGHLKSEDFFNVAKFPVATFEITSAKPVKSENGNYSITGKLTIKGITNTVTFPANVVVNNKTLTATGKVVVDRAKFDIRYGSGSFYDNLGDKMIYDEFELDLNLKATK